MLGFFYGKEKRLNIKKWLNGISVSFVLIAGLFMIGMSVQAGTVYDSPYVKRSPDGKAFTTNFQDKNWVHYDEGTSVDFGTTSSLRNPETGEHEYIKKRSGNIPIEKWEMVFRTGTCCHNDYPDEEDPYHYIDFVREPCLDSYYSGWNAFCADCHEPISNMHMYMSKEAAQSITELDLSLEYYYTCPHCSNLEQGSEFPDHNCKAISWNKYIVKYIANTNIFKGSMEPSIHMYNNATEHEGNLVTPATRLTKNAFERTGYEFTGWNTRADGSGKDYTDNQVIFNEIEENYNEAKNEGLITLYAQWKISESTLHINPNGGTYQGNSENTSITQTYRTTHDADPKDVVAPAGYTVSFVTGYSAKTPDIVQTRTFQEWQQSDVFHGRLEGNTYTYFGTEGMEDTITAIYGYDSVTLPLPVGMEESSSSFGGWYYDKDCTSPAGKAGDKITPDRDRTLYAKKVDLLLKSVNNMNPYGGSGAVDLSWEQNDGIKKNYLLYQSTDNKVWKRIYGASDLMETKNVSKTFNYVKGSNQSTYTIPYTGFYNVTAFGAKGADYNKIEGGYGGRVEGKIWLTKGEKVTYILGGEDGTNGGGTGTHYASGGGCTVISTDQKGTIIIAGGGGGATSKGNGGKGGSTESNLSTGYKGETGGAGGGGGYRGGKAGEYTVHKHSTACYKNVDTSYVALNRLSGTGAYPYSNHVIGGAHTHTFDKYGRRAHSATDNNGVYHITKGIPTNGNTSMTVNSFLWAWGTGHMVLEKSYIAVYDQNNTQIFKKFANDLPVYSGEGDLFNHTGKALMENGGIGTSSGFANCGHEYKYDGRVYYNETISIPENVTSVSVEIEFHVKSHDIGLWLEEKLNQVSFSGSKKVLKCGYTEGQVLSAKPAFGGSNHVFSNHFASYNKENGIKKDGGDGSFAIASEQIGFEEALYLKEVKAKDLASPNKVELSKNGKTDLGNNQVKIVWNESKDNGTVYYHKAESYEKKTTNKISTSNITRNELIAGTKGYYYLVDTNAGTAVSSTKGTFTSNTFTKVTVKDYAQYLHICAVDVAGNISTTTHIPIELGDSKIAWNVFTDNIQITSLKDSIYLSNDTNTYYVKADGKTPFLLKFNGYIKNIASKSYQVNYLVFDTSIKDSYDSTNIQYCLQVPNASSIQNTSIQIPYSDIHKMWSDSPLLLDDNYLTIKRSDYCKNLEILHRFTMPSSLHEKTIKVTPRAGATWQSEVMYSNYDKDFLNSIYLIGDGIPPEISGMEMLEDWKHVALSAKDSDSGLREFYVIVTNYDNGGFSTFTANEEGVLHIDASEDKTLFLGDFAMEFHAIDKVGNETIEQYGGRKLSVTAYIERILEPHTPIFRGGESGNLYVTTRGYVDKVEIIFPDEFVALSDKLNQAIEYPIPSHHKEEVYKFMIPLYSPEGTFQVKIKAYKDEEVRECNVSFTTLGEEVNVLNDIRTRLR